MKKRLFSIRDVCEIAILIALALILDKVKIRLGPTGGSFNLSCLPLLIIALRFPFLISLIAISIIFAFISCLFDGYGLACLPFDYVIAFSGYAFAGIFIKLFKFKNEHINILLGLLLTAILAFITRMVGHTLSSMILWEYELLPAVIYNLTYVPLSVGGVFVITIILSPILNKINKMFPRY